MGDLVYTRYVTLKNGKRLDAHDYGKSVFVFEGDSEYGKRKAEHAVEKLKKKIAEASNDNGEIL